MEAEDLLSDCVSAHMFDIIEIQDEGGPCIEQVLLCQELFSLLRNTLGPEHIICLRCFYLQFLHQHSPLICQ